MAVARAVYREVPNLDAVLAAVEQLRQLPAKPNSLIGWLIAASRVEQRKEAARHEARLELQESSLPEDLQEAILQASRRLGRPWRALLVWVRKALEAFGNPEWVVHALRLARSGDDASLNEALLCVKQWHPLVPPEIRPMEESEVLQWVREYNAKVSQAGQVLVEA